MTSDITVVIPVSPYHIDLLPQAIASVRAQTYPCETVLFFDEERRGAGYARNQALSQVRTDLLIFLDADDQLAPTFAERTLVLAQQTGHYIYTDWQDETGKRYSAPDCAWVDGTHHLITTLLPTAWVQAIEGFDEAMHGGEDSEFYTHLVTSGYCGVHLAETLVTYTHYGQRSQSWFQSDEFLITREQINLRYRGKAMGCCDDKPLAPPAPLGERVLVMPAWGLGTRNVIGMATGVNYGRLDASTPPVLMDRRDVAMRPDLFRVLEVPKSAPTGAASKTDGNFKALVGRLVGAMGGRSPLPAPRAYNPEPAEVVESKPNIERVLRLTGAPLLMKHSADPVFVFPEKDYPSYTDVRTLISLSGFQAASMSAANWNDPSQTYILLTPEALPAFEQKPAAKVIFWNLEYGGDYVPDLRFWKEEVWACDLDWAAGHGARFVVMGSHPQLGGTSEWAQKHYDATMLGYMTPRRQSLKDTLSDLLWDGIIYPGYGDARKLQLMRSRLMLHAHQHEGVAAIAPQRFALCAAYHLPLIHESVPDEGAYAGAAAFAPYDQLETVTRLGLTLSNDYGEALYEWLCQDLTFEKAVREALK